MKKKDKNVRTSSKTKSVGVKKTNVSYSGTPSKSVLQKIAGEMQQSMKHTDSDCKDCMNWCYCVTPTCDTLCSCVCNTDCTCSCSCISCVSQCQCSYCPRSARAEDYPSGSIEQIDEHLKELESLVQYRFSDIRVILKGLSQGHEHSERSQASVKNKFGDIEGILNQIPQKAEIPANPSKRKKRKHS